MDLFEYTPGAIAEYYPIFIRRKAQSPPSQKDEQNNKWQNSNDINKLPDFSRKMNRSNRIEKYCYEDKNTGERAFCLPSLNCCNQ
jgi:hypothetical protein